MQPAWRAALYTVAALLALAASWVDRADAAGLPDAAMCQTAIDSIEPTAGLPHRILSAIGTVESGRVDPRSGVVLPWPWTIDVEGAGHLYASAEEAIEAVRTAQSAGVRSIDVGCMQINLQHHPHAFARLEDAFEPRSNVLYAAHLLTTLHGASGNWTDAVAAYHSRSPALGSAYVRQVVAAWPMAAAYGVLPATVTAPQAARARRSLADQIDPGNALTPEFRATLIADASVGRGRTGDAALLVRPGALMVPLPSLLLAGSNPHAARSR